MKVFSDFKEGANTDDILAGLEDSVLLGVDAINMSLGTSCGFTRPTDEDYLNKVYDSIEKLEFHWLLLQVTLIQRVLILQAAILIKLQLLMQVLLDLHLLMKVLYL